MLSLTDLPTDEIQVGIWNCETSDWVGGGAGVVYSGLPTQAYGGTMSGRGSTLNVRKEGSHIMPARSP